MTEPKRGRKSKAKVVRDVVPFYEQSDDELRRLYCRLQEAIAAEPEGSADAPLLKGMRDHVGTWIGIGANHVDGSRASRRSTRNRRDQGKPVAEPEGFDAYVEDADTTSESSI